MAANYKSFILQNLTGLLVFQRHFTSYPKGFFSTKLTGVNLRYIYCFGFLNAVVGGNL